MTFDTAAARTASLIFAAAAVLVGCGGGSPDATPTEAVQSVTTPVAGTNTSVASATDSSDIDQATVQSAGSALLNASTTTLAPTSTAAMTASGTATSGLVTTPTETSTSTSTSTTTATSTATTSLTSGSTATTSLTSGGTTTTSLTSGSTATTAPISTDTEVAAAATTTSTPSVSVTLPVTSKTASARSGMAINLGGLLSNGSEFPTIDLMKKASPWFTQCVGGANCANFAAGANGFDTQEESKLNLDADGWIKSLPASSDTTTKYRQVSTKLAEGLVQQAGTYTVVYDGAGTITYSGAASKVASQSRAGHDTVNVTTTGNAGAMPFYLTITATDPTNYIRNIRVYMPGGACQNDLTTYAASAAACTTSTGAYVPFESFPAGSMWHPVFLSSIKGFRALRFMDWGNTNSSMAVNWTDRTSPTARSWFTTTSTGAPVEAMFDLAAKVGADPWMNIPPHATDAYVHAYAQLAHSKLPANSKLALEYGNEMWNYSFPATRWALAQSQQVFASQLAAGANSVVVEQNWYAMRLAQVCQIVKQEFGADASRVQCVANTQAANWGNTGEVLKCTYAKTLLGGQPCYKFIDVVAIAPYFGGYIGTSTTTATVDAWTADADGGLAKMFQELTGLGSTGSPAVTPLSKMIAGVPQGSVAQTSSWMTATKAVLDTYGVPMWAYEGGQSLIPAANDAKALALMIAANRDPRMAGAYQTLLTNWKNAGGQTFALFNDVGAYRASGMWGLRENQWDTTTPKWKTAVAWRDNNACWWAGC